MNKTLLDQAVKQGTIDQQQADQLTLMGGHPTKQEPLRLLNNFGDVFVALGIGLVTLSTAQFHTSFYANFMLIIAYPLAAEWLVKRHRFNMTGIVLFFSLLYFAYTLLAPITTSMTMALSLAGLSIAFYLRYKIPLSAAVAAVGITLSVITLITTLLDIKTEHHFLQMVALGGLATFAIAMRLDSQDIKRQTYRSDTAFWLHMVASQMITHGIAFTILMLDSTFKNWLLCLLFISLTLIALYIDRRSIMLASMGYTTYALTQLLPYENYLWILIGLGALIIFLGTYWHHARFKIFGRTQHWKIYRWMPPILEPK